MADRVQNKVRLDADLHEMLIQCAKRASHTLNAEINQRLRRSFRDDDVRELLREAIGSYGDPPAMIPHDDAALN